MNEQQQQQQEEGRSRREAAALLDLRSRLLSCLQVPGGAGGLG